MVGHATNRMALLASFILAVGLTACSDSESPVEPSPQVEGVPGAWVSWGMEVRTYQWTLPPADQTAAPILVVLHGQGSSGSDIRSYSELDRAAERGVLVVYPDGVGGEWGVGCDCTGADAAGIDDVTFLRQLLDEVGRLVPQADPTRVFLAGFSQGAMMAQRVACQLGDRIAGVVAVGAGEPVRGSGDCRPATPLRAALIHGLLDPVVPWEGSSTIRSIEATAQAWASRAGCSGAHRTALPDTVEDSTTAWAEDWVGCHPGSAVRLIGVEGGPVRPPPFPPGWAARPTTSPQRMSSFPSSFRSNQ